MGLRRLAAPPAVLLALLCGVTGAAAAARVPLAVTGGRIALETVCGAPHGVHVTTDGARIAVHSRSRRPVRTARCESGRWIATNSLRDPGEYRLTLRHQRRYVRVLD